MAIGTLLGLWERERRGHQTTCIGPLNIAWCLRYLFLKLLSDWQKWKFSEKFEYQQFIPLLEVILKRACTEKVQSPKVNSGKWGGGNVAAT